MIESRQKWIFYIEFSEKASLRGLGIFKGEKDSALRNKKVTVYLVHGRLKGNCSEVRLPSWERARRQKWSVHFPSLSE